MNKDWIKIVVAALFEIGWVIGLKHASGFGEWSATILAIAASFYLLVTGSRYLPVGTAYAVFVGFGTTGTVLAEIVLFGEPFLWSKIIFILLLLSGVIGLKLVTDDKKEAEA